MKQQAMIDAPKVGVKNMFGSLGGAFTATIMAETIALKRIAVSILRIISEIPNRRQGPVRCNYCITLGVYLQA